MKETLGKVLYGALFAVVLPALLVAWARATARVVTIPLLHAPMAGRALAAGGALLMVSGWYALYRHGGGLPMNAFPPPRRVTRGPYALVAHPIYVGFCALCFGVSLAVGSSSGFWLVSPAMVLASAALVLGYERENLLARLGPTEARPWLSLPAAEPAAPTLAERLAIHALVILLWGAVYEVVAAAGPAPDAVSTCLPLDDRLPVWERTEAIYASTYALVLAAPLVARTRRDLRALAVRGLLSTALIFPLYLAFPLVSPPRAFHAEGALGALLLKERAWDTPGCAFPSFHVVWAFLAAEAFSSRFPRARAAFTALAWLISLSCITTGMHSILDVVGGLLAYQLVARHTAVWAALRGAAERIANSWRERRVGPARIINHGAWAALANFGGLSLVGTLIGPGHTLSVVIAAGCGLVCAALWAQIVEGSPALLRPYGFYGGMLGVTLGALAAPLTGTGVWELLAACCVAGPWVQSVGRLRCLVQGCCHGHEAPAAIGIRYTHPRSRVCRLSALGGVPVHPTPVYSILWNVVIALVVGRLWSLHAPLHFIAGVYLGLSGLGRFVEEAYRGEPQTPIYARLRFYQWVALGTVITGAAITALLASAPAPAPRANGLGVLAAAVFGILTGFALGVDFPESNRRFARLA